MNDRRETHRLFDISYSPSPALSRTTFAFKIHAASGMRAITDD